MDATFTSSLSNFEQAPPYRVHREGVKNYVKNRGTLNIGEWATESRRMSISEDPSELNYSQPKVLGPDALRNYEKSRASTPNLIYGNVQPPNSRQGLRVTREALSNYEKSHNSQVKSLLQSYGKLPLETPKVPHIQGELATKLFYTHQEGQMGPILHDYRHVSTTPRPIPHVKGSDAEVNRQKGQGDSQLLEHHKSRRVTSTPEPHVKGVQAQLNYEMGQGQNVNQLFHQYGKLPQSTPTQPKVKYDGVQNLINGRGDAMRKTLEQCPPTSRYRESSGYEQVWP